MACPKYGVALVTMAFALGILPGDQETSWMMRSAVHEQRAPTILSRRFQCADMDGESCEQQ